MSNIAIVERNLSTQLQLKDMLSKVGITTYLSSTLNELLAIIQNSSNIDLVLLEYNESYTENIVFLDKIKTLGIDIPVIIISSSNKREVFIKSIEKGAVDFILKPLEEEYVIKKILKVLTDSKKQGLEQLEGINVNFTKYISGEFIKAKKGDYKITIMFLIIKLVDDKEISSLEYYKYNQILFDNIQKHIWETDIIVKYGAQSVIGIFPFCDDDGILRLEHKIEEIYQYLKDTYKQFEEVCIEGFYLIYPDDGDTKEKLFGQLMKRVEK